MQTAHSAVLFCRGSSLSSNGYTHTQIKDYHHHYYYILIIRVHVKNVEKGGLPRGLGIQWTTTAAWLSQDKWVKLILFTSWMACFPHRFQFREQSRKKNKKARKLGALFFFFFIERALVRFFGKLKDAAMQFDPPSPPPNLFLFSNPYLVRTVLSELKISR